MRQIGTFLEKPAAVRFAAYLVTQGVHAHTEEHDNTWSIWVREEDQVNQAKTALAEFQSDPENPRYRDVERLAGAKVREENSKREVAKQNVVEMRSRWNTRRSPASRPLTIALVLLCCGLYIASDVGRDSNNTVLRTLMFRDQAKAAREGLGESAEDKLIDIRSGQLWRLITPAFLHGHVLHLTFNMVMFYQLAGAIEQRRRTWRLGLMILAIAFTSNFVQATMPNQWGGTSNFLGLSGVVYGLFGYVWMKSRFQPQLGLYIDRGTVVLLIVFMVLGFANQLPQAVANWAHGIGLLTGMAIALAPLLWKRSGD